MAQAMQDYLTFLKGQVEGYEGDYQEIVSHVPTYFALLTGLLDDSRFPPELRPVVNCALAYFISPFDFGSDEAVGAEGYVDDVFVCALAIRKIRERLDDQQVMLDHWEGEEDVFALSDNIIETLNEELGEDSTDLIRQYTGLDVA
jgi:uncharacterized membrane protein YkvA (DUF1232 family)